MEMYGNCAVKEEQKIENLVVIEENMGSKEKKASIREQRLKKEMNIAAKKAMIEAVTGDYVYQSSSARAADIVTQRLTEIGIMLAAERNRKVCNQITSRLKSTDSIYKKILKKKYTFDEAGVFSCNDLIGVRMVCLFIDDVYAVKESLSEQPDIHIIKEKDYIKKPKSNGYMSLHLIIEVPIEKFDENYNGQWRRVEIQLRTVAMDFWSVLDHQLLYKKEFPGAEPIARELRDYAATIAQLDTNMLELRKKIDMIK